MPDLRLSVEQRREQWGAGSAGIGEVRHRQRQIERHVEHVNRRVKGWCQGECDSWAPDQQGTCAAGKGMWFLEVVQCSAWTGTNGRVRGDDSKWDQSMRVVMELSDWPLVRLLGCLDVREFWASLRWQISGGMLAVITVGSAG